MQEAAQSVEEAREGRRRQSRHTNVPAERTDLPQALATVQTPTRDGQRERAFEQTLRYPAPAVPV